MLWRRDGARVGPVLAAGSGVTVAVTAIVATWHVAPYPLWIWLPVELAGVAFTVCGAVLWFRRPANGTGRLMAATGLAWYVGALQLSTHPLLYALGFCLYHLGTVVMAHVVLAYPGGRLVGPVPRAVVGLIYAGLATQVARYVVEYPPQPQGWGDPGAEYSAWALVGSLNQVVTTITIAVIIAARWSRTVRIDRREHTPVWTIALALCAVTLATNLAAVTHASVLVQQWLLLAYAVQLLALPVAIAIGVLRVRLVQGRLGDLLIRLDRQVDRDGLEAGLRHALDDPSLELRYPVDGGGGLGASGRAVTAIEHDGVVVAVLVHDPAVARRRALLDSAVAATRLALVRAVRDAEVRELSSSQRRIAVAADAERHRIQRDLHDAVQPKLVAAAMLSERIGQLAPELDRVSRILREAIDDLRTLSGGIHPPGLDDHGLAEAVQSLAEVAPVPVELDIPTGRWPEQVERTAYFVIAESLANVYKHACATGCRVRVSDDDGRLVVEVSDDGIGGADPARGSGLRGLRDRTAAAGGSLRIASGDSGTTVIAELPCES